VTQDGFGTDLEEVIWISGAMGGDYCAGKNTVGIGVFVSKDLSGFVTIYKE
jgi:hypothetical protein